MSYGLVMLIALALVIVRDTKEKRDREARAEAMRRHPAGRGR